MESLDGPSNDGFNPPNPDDLFAIQQAQSPDQDALLEQRKIEAKKAAEDTEEPVLTAQEENEVVDLINAGCKDQEIEVFNRRIRLRTLTIEEELKVSEITKPYIGSDGYARCYRTAVVAAAIRTIDGKLLFDPMSPTEFDQIIKKKYELLLGYYPLAVDTVYGHYREMELELLALVDKLGKSQG